MRDRDEIEFICTFTSGRSGTALLSQVFGGNNWQKRQYHYNNQNLICHEAWPSKSIPVSEIKNCISLGDSKSIKIQKDTLDYQLKKALTKYPDVKKYFITDHRIGRYFCYYVSQLAKSKIIYIERDKDKTIHSLYLGGKTEKVAGGKKNLITSSRESGRSVFTAAQICVV